MRIKNPRCEGCLLSICKLAKHNVKDNLGPCTECIVKPMCDTSCPAYDHYEHMTGTKIHLGEYKNEKAN